MTEIVALRRKKNPMNKNTDGIYTPPPDCLASCTDERPIDMATRSFIA